MRARPIAIPLIITAVATAAAPAAAQDPVPAELVRALLAWPAPGGQAPVIVAGRLPDRFPNNVVPAGARVLGGLSRDTTSETAALAVAQAPADAMASLRQSLAQAGWTLPEAQATPRGFVDAVARQWNIYCRERETLSVSSAPNPGGGAYVRMEHTSSAARMPTCALMNRTAGQRSIWADVPMPALTAPAGATQSTNGSVPTGPMMSGGVQARARVRTGLTPAALVAHYATQLQAAGWTPLASTSSPGLAAQPFRTRVADKEWFGMLTAVAIPDSQVRDVEFQITALPPQDWPF